MNILVTGGAGYIGSHTVLQLLQSNYKVVVLDNLVNSSESSIRRVEEISGRRIEFFKGDIRDYNFLDGVFSSHKFDSVLHFAGLKAVGEAINEPIKYYENNVLGSIQLFKVMQKYNTKSIIFSSSATVYGNSNNSPLKEDMPTGIPTNPYGRSKLVIENILADLYVSDPQWCITSLRYFNPVGAHKSGLIGEDPRGLPNNLLPYISQTAVGIHEKMFVFGNDYDTPDGTGIRDYIHVMDLASGHIRALEKYISKRGVHTINLGTGIGYSVLEVIHAFETVSAKTIPYDIIDRRPGDVGVCYADPSKANSELDWVANRGLIEMCKDTWRWQSQKLLL